jgi:DNA polymerase-1
MIPDEIVRFFSGRYHPLLGRATLRSSTACDPRANLESAIAKVMLGLMTPRQLIGLAASRLPGWGLWELDLAQAELRVAAMWAKCDRMISAIVEGRDLHAETATELFKVTPDHEAWGKYRQVGKRGNFTLCFGAGGKTFQGMVRKETGIALTDREAERIVRDWNDLYPEFSRAIERHMVRAERLRYVPLVNGRRRWFARWEETHKAFNQRVQGSLAELGKDWMLKSDAYLIEKGLDERGVEEGVGRAGLLLTIHDSQVLLLPEGAEGEAMAEQCAAFGREVWAEMFPEIPGGVDLKKWGAK